MSEIEQAPLTPHEQQALVADIRAKATDLAEALRLATDRGVSHAIVLPQLVLVFRQVFGEMPAGMQMPDLSALGLGGGS